MEGGYRSEELIVLLWKGVLDNRLAMQMTSSDYLHSASHSRRVYVFLGEGEFAPYAE